MLSYGTFYLIPLVPQTLTLLLHDASAEVLSILPLQNYLRPLPECIQGFNFPLIYIVMQEDWEST